MTDSAVTRYEVEARVVRRGVSVGAAKTSEIVFDSSREQSDSLPGPAELLALSFAACVLKNVERFSELISFRYEGADIHVEAEREDDPPRFVRIRYTLRLRTDERPSRVDLLQRNLRKFGTVYNTLAGACEISGDIAAGPEAAEAFAETPAAPSDQSSF